MPYRTSLLKWKHFLSTLESPQGAGPKGNQHRQLWLLEGAGQGEQKGREERDEECQGERVKNLSAKVAEYKRGPCCQYRQRLLSEVILN